MIFNLKIEICIKKIIILFRGTANDDKRQLLVLHPFKISIYSLQATEGLAEHGKFFFFTFDIKINKHFNLIFFCSLVEQECNLN